MAQTRNGTRKNGTILKTVKYSRYCRLFSARRTACRCYTASRAPPGNGGNGKKEPANENDFQKKTEKLSSKGKVKRIADLLSFAQMKKSRRKSGKSFWGNFLGTRKNWNNLRQSNINRTI